MNYEYDPMFDQKPKQENTAAGILGALLGSLAGVVCIVLISQLNYVASVSGLVMAVCALKGYEKLAGTLSKKGAVLSVVIIVIMTYFAHHLDITISLMREAGLSFFEAFVLIPQLLQLDILDGTYFWGNLAMLYLFTLLGAVPTIYNSMRTPVPQYFPMQNPPAGGMQTGPAGSVPPADAGNMQAAQTVLWGGIPATSAQAAFGQDAGTYTAPAQGAQAFPPQNVQAASAAVEFFPPDRRMTAKPRYGGLCLALFYFVTGFALFIGGAVTDTPYITPVLGGLVLIFCALFPYITGLLYVPDTMLLFVRVNGTLWRINLEQLNKQAGYHFTGRAITLTGVRWHNLQPEEQQRAKLSIQYLIAAIESARVESTQIESTQSRLFGSVDMLVATPLPEAVLLKETRWAWKISYLASNGKRRKLTIHKSYPGLAPAPGCRPAGQPVPFCWRSTIISVILALVFGGLFLAMDLL